MSESFIVSRNSNSGFFENGKSFSASKWKAIADIYWREVEESGHCTVRTLAKKACISEGSAAKAIRTASSGASVPIKSDRGHKKKGPGSIKYFGTEHHKFLYALYQKNPALPLYGYCEELWFQYGIQVSSMLVSRWFSEIGRYKGTLRVTDVRPDRRDTYENCWKLKQYLHTIKNVKDVRRLVFSDEKPMKEIMIFSKTRRDVMKGNVPKNFVPSTAKNRFNILCATNIKGKNIPPVEFFILDDLTTTSAIFIQFVKKLITKKILQKGDYFIVDNCSIHNKGDNIGLRNALKNLFQIELIMLPPYSPELNPTELVFRSLLMKLRAEKRRYNCINAIDFKDAIEKVLMNMGLPEILSHYVECKYL